MGGPWCCTLSFSQHKRRHVDECCECLKVVSMTLESKVRDQSSLENLADEEKELNSIASEPLWTMANGA